MWNLMPKRAAVNELTEKLKTSHSEARCVPRNLSFPGFQSKSDCSRSLPRPLPGLGMTTRETCPQSVRACPALCQAMACCAQEQRRPRAIRNLAAREHRRRVYVCRLSLARSCSVPQWRSAGLDSVANTRRIFFILRTNSSNCGRIYSQKMALPCRRAFFFPSLAVRRRIDMPAHRTELISYQVVGQQKNNLNCLVPCNFWTE